MTTGSTDRPSYVVTFTDAGKLSPTGYRHPAPRRLAGLLKTALRAFGFRCIDVREATPTTEEQRRAPSDN